MTWDLLRKIAATESRFDSLAIHDNDTGKSYSPPDAVSATTLVRELMAAGHSVDAGLMQINSANFARLSLSAESAFDPCRSIEAGAQILSLVSRYNTGDDRNGIANGYVRKVITGAPQAGAAQNGEGKVRKPIAAPEAPPHDWDVFRNEDEQSESAEVASPAEAPSVAVPSPNTDDAGRNISQSDTQK